MLTAILPVQPPWTWNKCVVKQARKPKSYKKNQNTQQRTIVQPVVSITNLGARVHAFGPAASVSPLLKISGTGLLKFKAHFS